MWGRMRWSHQIRTFCTTAVGKDHGYCRNSDVMVDLILHYLKVERSGID